ncbi:hypothetical protein GCM10023210_37770 [Chryseobacterium ginsengisoli]|uniref:2'-5' RNA ligase n=1 Tax=Chryseobacterium ginsengisoli TaxID=363853 RepID=A0ABP9MSG0_9FLAO
MKKLYFIAVYPPQEVIEEIKIFKKDFALNYENSKALKNDAHITLFPPFSRELNWKVIFMMLFIKSIQIFLLLKLN